MALAVGLLATDVAADPVCKPVGVDKCPGNLVGLRTADGHYVSRCEGCSRGAADANSVTLHMTDPTGHGWVQWAFTKLANGKVAFQCNDSKKYLARCNGCHPGGKFPNAAFVHEDTYIDKDVAQWNVLPVPNTGKVVLQSDNGLYLAACTNCVPAGSYPVFVFDQATSVNDPDAQFEVVCLDQVTGAPLS
ncbi:TPA: hypothetical protein N0F65_005805 [Lagenidium giganteum]|uniref:Uncharacterized protein n=1 Tax=Lagenidium giganteum TaxID=4803 RepID=A0AAV2YSC4_9STRA|nr:TPA: hypothetical protein N0F65_005805 [Lagenidium giganteum]